MSNASRERSLSFRQRLASPFSRRDLVEAALVGIAFLLYFGVRGAVIDRPEVAYFNALDIVELQRSMGVFVEDTMNRWAQDSLFLAQSMNIIYFYLHFPIIIIFGIWLYFFRRHRYTLMRDAFLASGAIALVVYWLYPVAPPRELGALATEFDANPPPYVFAFVDTMKEHLGYAYDTQSTRWFVNPYAAMPSLHFGWDLLLGIGIIWAFWRERWIWIMAPIGVSLPIMQIFSITITANHYLLDAVAGGIVAFMGLGVALALQRWGYPALTRAIERLPFPTLKRWLQAYRDPRRKSPETAAG